MQIPTFDDVKKAANKIEGHAFRTPLLQSTVLNETVGANVFIKPENLQRTGSFKFRGAYNTIASLSEEARGRGIVACSSGNHAQGVAAASAIFGAKATILMPSDAPKNKMSRTAALGAKIVEFDRECDDRDVVTAELVQQTGGTLVHPFENPHVIAGQGTVGLEICQDLNAKGISADHVLVCTGGGGLTAGVALAVSEYFPEAKVHSVEPEGFDDYKKSLEAGQLVSNDRTAGSVCDAIITRTPGKTGFEINRSRLALGLVVSDDEALRAVKFAFEELKLVAEPGGAVALAAVLKHGHQWSGENIVITISGGNIDPTVLSQALSA